MGIFTEIFAWWTGNTIGTRVSLWRYGAEQVGEDEWGNRYYRAPEGYKGQGERRYVTYSKLAEASKVPPIWHGWLHHMFDDVPTKDDLKTYEWQTPHQPNMTGTPLAYRPPGSTQSGGQRAPASSDYEAWSPK